MPKSFDFMTRPLPGTSCLHRVSHFASPCSVTHLQVPRESKSFALPGHQQEEGFDPDKKKHNGGWFSPLHGYQQPYLPQREPKSKTIPAHQWTKVKQPLAEEANEWNITLIHTNDIHARMDPFNDFGTDCTSVDKKVHHCYGGIARIKHVVDVVRKHRKQTFLFDAGDQFQGTLFFSHYQGNFTAKFMNAMQYDVWTNGNHEFDSGVGVLGQFLRQLNFPNVVSNMNVAKEPALRGLVQPYVVLTKYGSRLGVVGFITKTLTNIAATGEKVTVEDPAGPVQRAIDELHKLGVYRIIGLSHNGYDADKEVAEKTHGLALIVGGHSHTLLNKDSSLPHVKGPFPTKVKGKKGRKVYIVQAKMFGEWVGVLDLHWKGRELVRFRGNPIHLSDYIHQDRAFLKVVDQFRKPFEEQAGAVLAEAEIDLPKDPCRTQSCPLGNMVTNALLWAHSKKRDDLPVISLLNTGGLRSGLAKGEITRGNLMTLLPFDNFMVEVVVNGEYVRKALENTFCEKNLQNGNEVASFGQWGGMEAEVDDRQPEGKKVIKIKAKTLKGDWIELTDAQEVVLVTIDYLIKGNTGIVPEAMKDVPKQAKLSDLTEAYLKEEKTIGKAFEEERLKIIPNKEKEKQKKEKKKEE
jgi:5'-nucleotidase